MATGCDCGWTDKPPRERAVTLHAVTCALQSCALPSKPPSTDTYRVFHDGIGEPDTVTLVGLFAVNEFNEFDQAAIRSLEIGQACEFGGGAAPEVIVRRVS